MDRSLLDEAADRIAHLVNETESEGYETSKVWNLQEWRRLREHDRKEVTERLRYIHRIVEHEIRSSGRGRRKKVYINVKHMKD